MGRGMFSIPVLLALMLHANGASASIVTTVFSGTVGNGLGADNSYDKDTLEIFGPGAPGGGAINYYGQPITLTWTYNTDDFYDAGSFIVTSVPTIVYKETLPEVADAGSISVTLNGVTVTLISLNYAVFNYTDNKVGFGLIGPALDGSGFGNTYFNIFTASPPSFGQPVNPEIIAGRQLTVDQVGIAFSTKTANISEYYDLQIGSSTTTISTVPEPGSLALFCTAVLGVLGTLVRQASRLWRTVRGASAAPPAVDTFAA